ncbi:hypothetical protein Cni_G19100 [Canna indica]|uniref:C2 domain-containing protein n=1 Tax=Canna indica TaxID=4628 RepID=A0AAQ3KKL1_9LILI|nr:hypothetical protein Cni_G19100 [Canna indica]
MSFRTLEITLISAKALKDVNLFSKMAVYAVVSISCDSRTRLRTQPDREGGRNPSWNSTLRLTIPADAGVASGHTLHILLRTERTFGDRDVGEVRVPLSEMLSAASGETTPRPVQFVSYQVRRTGSGKPKGVLNFSYKLGDRVEAPAARPVAYPPQSATYPIAATAPPYPHGAPPSSKVDEPVMAYPVGPSSAAYPAYGAAAPYPPPYVYQQAPPYGYGYPPAGYGYGYGAAAAPPVKQQPRKNNFGMGLGAGLLGGAVGGLLIGDMISDASAYDTGYDAGFDDAGFGF